MEGQAITAITANKTIKVKKEGFKWGQELLKAKAIIAEQQEAIEKLETESEDLYRINTNFEKGIATLKQENENLKTELAGDDARMYKMEQEFKLKLRKKIAENKKLEAENKRLKEKVKDLKTQLRKANEDPYPDWTDRVQEYEDQIEEYEAKVQKAYEGGYDDGESSITVVSAIAYLEENGYDCTTKI